MAPSSAAVTAAARSVPTDAADPDAAAYASLIPEPLRLHRGGELLALPALLPVASRPTPSTATAASPPGDIRAASPVLIGGEVDPEARLAALRERGEGSPTGGGGGAFSDSASSSSASTVSSPSSPSSSSSPSAPPSPAAAGAWRGGVVRLPPGAPSGAASAAGAVGAATAADGEQHPGDGLGVDDQDGRATATGGGGVVLPTGPTAAERAFGTVAERREAERIAAAARVTHRENIEAFNATLAKEPEHYDLFKVGLTK